MCVIVYVLTDRMKKWVREKERKREHARERERHKTAERQKTSNMLGLFHVAFFPLLGKDRQSKAPAESFGGWMWGWCGREVGWGGDRWRVSV